MTRDDAAPLSNRAVVIPRFGAADVLELRELPMPVPGPGQLLVRVEAAGVAYADVLMRMGLYPETPPTPFTPGYDVVGRVVGPDDGTSWVGTRVAALCVTGGCAAYALVPADLAVPVPDELPAEDLVALVLNYVTAHQLLHRVAEVKAGDTVLVIGAAGGVGTAAIELAGIADVHCLGVASGDRVVAVAALGAAAIDRGNGVGLVEQVLALAPRGVDAVLDPVGGPQLAVSRSLTRRRGTVASYGIAFAVDAGMGRRRALVQHTVALARAKVARGVRTRLYVIAGKRGAATRDPASFRADLGSLVDLLGFGRLAPTTLTLPLSEVAEAHRMLEAGEVVGKIVLIP